jgi:hypothetical protein
MKKYLKRYFFRFDLLEFLIEQTDDSFVEGMRRYEGELGQR